MEKGLVLLVEDDIQMRRFLRVALESEGYRLVEAETARDGLSQAATRNPDAVLLDLGLPDMDGLELIGQAPGVVPGARSSFSPPGSRRTIKSGLSMRAPMTT